MNRCIVDLGSCDGVNETVFLAFTFGAAKFLGTSKAAVEQTLVSDCHTRVPKIVSAS